MKFAAALSFLFLSCSAFLMADNAALAAKAREQIGVTTSYDGSYQVIPYPNGDVPKDTGVCTEHRQRHAGGRLPVFLHHYRTLPPGAETLTRGTASRRTS
ncbi:MAG: DUF1287 domain-containing protein [Corynebacterium kroppenstedtii]|nr:DUF1287 domain-containing protein [Corynebacterium kroppenstedtii]